jgi:Protein kinase domain
MARKCRCLQAVGRARAPGISVAAANPIGSAASNGARTRMIGQTIGKYRVTGQLGRGATGLVYRAVDATLDREVAIKVLNPDLASPDIIKRFRVEATTLARLNHPDIATIYELLPSGDDLLMVMELVRGQTLDRLLERHGPMSPELAAPIIDRILSALEHAHRAGIVHRDMKPANVMVTIAGGVKIMDFGIARVRGAEHMTIDGLMMGTPAYMAPEQGLGEEVDERTDIYSVGVVFYRLLSGALPFKADSPIAMLQRKVVDAPLPLREQRDELPEWCEAVAQRALARLPADRYQTAEEFRQALRAAGPDLTIDIAKACDVEEDAACSPAQAEPVGSPEVSRTETIVVAHTARASITQTAKGLVRRGKPSGAQAVVMTAILVASLAMLAYVAPRPPGPERTTPAPPPPLAFDIRVVVGVGERQRQPEAQLLLGSGNLTVLVDQAEDPLYSAPYKTIRSISYSRTAEPMWQSAQGPARVARIRSGVLGELGILQERHWVSVRTAEDRFVILRAGERLVAAMLTALEERTGRKVERVR